SLAGAVATPNATNAVQLYRLDNFAPSTGNGEGVSFDPTTDRAFMLNTEGDRIEILSISASGAVSSVGAINLAQHPDLGLLSGGNSVAVKNGVVAVAFSGGQPGENGYIALYDTNGTLLNTVEVGAGPDQVVFTADGKKILVANEGEPFT